MKLQTFWILCGCGLFLLAPVIQYRMLILGSVVDKRSGTEYQRPNNDGYSLVAFFINFVDENE